MNNVREKLNKVRKEPKLRTGFREDNIRQGLWSDDKRVQDKGSEK